MQSLTTAEGVTTVVKQLKNLHLSNPNMALFCDVCQVQVSSETVMQIHVKGKRHIQLEKLQEKQTSSAARSIYVRGFPPNSSVDQLTRFFESFGKVDKVIVDKEHGLYAIIEFTEASTAKTTLSSPNIFMNKCRLAIRPRQFKGILPKRKMIESRDANNSPKANPTKDVALIDIEKIQEKMKDCINIEEEMELLVNELSLSSDEIDQRHSILQELESILQKSLKSDCSVHQFGSSVNGLGTKGCDLDLFLDLHPEESLAHSDSEAQGSQHEVQSSTSPFSGSDVNGSGNGRSGGAIDSHSGDELRDSQSTESLSAHLASVADILHSRSDIYARVVRVRSARCPVVKFLHLQSGLKCDLSVKNRLALRNTLLIKFLLCSDIRICPLIFSIRQWAKLKGVAGQANTGSKLTNYALTMLVFFYLQNLSPPLLPPVDLLSHLSETRIVVDGWDCSFVTDSSKLTKPAENNLTQGQLIAGFFQFFSFFSFDQKVICVRSGKAVDLKDFSDQMADDARLRRFKISPIMVQDPFVLNHNIASNVNDKSLAEIRKTLATTADFPYGAEEMTSLRGEVRLHSLLFSATPFVIESPSMSLTETEGGTDGAGAGKRGSQRFTIKADVTKLMMEVVRQQKSVAEVKDIWCQNAVKIIDKVLEIYHMSSVHVKSQDCNGRVKYDGEDEMPSDDSGLKGSVDQQISDESLHTTESVDRSCDNGCTVNANEVDGCITSLETTNRKRCSAESDDGNEHKRSRNSSTDIISATDNCVSMDNAPLLLGTQTITAHKCEAQNPSFSLDEDENKSVDKSQNHGTSLLLSLHCSTKARLWVGRKKIRKQLMHIAGEYNKELEISRLIKTETKSEKGLEIRDDSEPILAFDMYVWKAQSSVPALAVAFEIDDSQRLKELRCFLFSYQSVVEKFVDRYVMEDFETWTQKTKDTDAADI